MIVDHTGGAASKAGAALSKAALRKASARWLDEPSLQKTHEQLVQRLKNSGRRFLVFIDDIDRLTSAEVRTVMQMVKTIGRLPNVTYCLAYDRAIVWEALREMAPGDANRSGFAEKIVQHELEVPVPSRTGLMRMLTAALPDLPTAPPHSLRWMEMTQAGLGKWIRHPRDVAKLANAMQFACSRSRSSWCRSARDRSGRAAARAPSRSTKAPPYPRATIGHRVRSSAVQVPGCDDLNGFPHMTPFPDHVVHIRGAALITFAASSATRVWSRFRTHKAAPNGTTQS